MVRNLLMGLSIMISACSSNHSDLPSTETSTEIYFVPIVGIERDSLEWELHKEKTFEQLKHNNEYKVAQKRLSDLSWKLCYSKHTDWQNLYLEVTEYLNDENNFEYVEKYDAVQTLGNLLLKYQIFPDSTTNNGKTEAISMITEKLVEVKHPDAYVIHEALTRLKGVWSKEKIINASKITYESAVEYLKKWGCTDCFDGFLPEQKKYLFEKNSQTFALIINALPELRKIYTVNGISQSI